MLLLTRAWLTIAALCIWSHWERANGDRWSLGAVAEKENSSLSTLSECVSNTGKPGSSYAHIVRWLCPHWRCRLYKLNQTACLGIRTDQVEFTHGNCQKSPNELTRIEDTQLEARNVLSMTDARSRANWQIIKLAVTSATGLQQIYNGSVAQLLRQTKRPIAVEANIRSGIQIQLGHRKIS